MRKAPIVPMDLLKQKVQELMNPDDNIKKPRALRRTEYFPYNMPKRMDNDLGKISFDWENWDDGNLKDRTKDNGFETLPNGLPILWMWAGGDWEFPVTFVLYWDGKGLRAYIPEEGNVYNKERKSDYGNNDEEEGEAQDFDYDKMRLDIMNRIKII